MEIRTNNIPRNLKYGYEMPEKFKADFDYIPEDEFNNHAFFEYKKQWYDLGEFIRTSATIPELKAWQGYSSDSAFSGVVVRLINNDKIIVGKFFY